MNVVKNDIKKFHSQLEAVVNAIPLARYLIGKISAVIAQTYSDMPS